MKQKRIEQKLRKFLMDKLMLPKVCSLANLLNLTVSRENSYRSCDMVQMI